MSAPLTLAEDDTDPYVTPCPAWCVLGVDGRHTVESNDEDRYHGGDITSVSIRSLGMKAHVPPANSGERIRYTQEYVTGYLMPRVLHSDPQIHVDLSGTSVGADLTLDEAEAIGRMLLAMVEAAR